MESPIHHHIIDRFAFANSIISGIALYPQLFLLLQTHTASSVSTITYGAIMLNSIVWLFYAIHREILPLGISSLLNLIASFCIILLTAPF